MSTLKKLNRAELRNVQGGVFKPGTGDIKKCGCSCTGAVTGPSYCQYMIACPQVMTC